jgi:hypothetical protein
VCAIATGLCKLGVLSRRFAQLAVARTLPHMLNDAVRGIGWQKGAAMLAGDCGFQNTRHAGATYWCKM